MSRRSTNTPTTHLVLYHHDEPITASYISSTSGSWIHRSLFIPSLTWANLPPIDP